MYTSRVSFSSFDFAALAASLSFTQAAGAQALVRGFGDGYGPAFPSSPLSGFGLGTGGADFMGLSAPDGYDGKSLEQAFASLKLFAAQLSISFGQSSEISSNRTKAYLDGVSGEVTKTKAEGEDKFAVHQSCVSNTVGNPSNMNNSDHIALAINDILKNSSETRDGTNFKAMKPEDLKQKLKEQYGIDSELTKVKDKAGTEIAALKFSNGAVFADGAGDGKLDTGDYNFSGKVKEIEKKYGVSADELVKGMKDQKATMDAYGIPGDLSGALQSGMQGTADRAKWAKEVEEARGRLKSQYGVDAGPGVAAQFLEQERLAKQFGIELGPEQLRSMAQQTSLAMDPGIQLYLQQLMAFAPSGLDLGSLFRLGLGLSMT